MTQLDPVTDLDSCGGLVGLSPLPVLVAFDDGCLVLIDCLIGTMGGTRRRRRRR